MFLIADNLHKSNLQPLRWTLCLLCFTFMFALQDRKVAILLYGFPPGVGATGTAALLNVPKSLESALEALRAQGYNLGLEKDAKVDGEAIIRALKMQEDQRAVSMGAQGIESL